MKVNSFILIGIALILIGFFAPNLLAVLVADSSPPTISLLSKPAPGAAYPFDTLGLTLLSARCNDPESNITSATTTIDTQTYTLSLTKVDGSIAQYWTKNVSALTVGVHSFSTTVTNGVNLTSTMSGSFTIYGGLAGNWLINGVLISSPTQVVTSQSLTITFRFEKTSGKADAYITAQVLEGGTGILTLSNSAAAVWTGTYTFTTGGKHVLALTAKDDVATITMQTLSVDFGGSTLASFNMTQVMFWIAGAAFLAFGFMNKRKKAIL